MIRRLARLSALGLLVLAPAWTLFAQEDEALSPQLLEARRIFVKQTLIDPKIVSRFRSEIARWDRFEVVASAGEADIVASLSAEAEYTHTVSDSGGAADEDTPGTSGRAGETGPRPIGTVRVLQDIHLTIVLGDGTEVWRDAVPAGSLSGNAAKKLAKRLRKRLEEESS